MDNSPVFTDILPSQASLAPSFIDTPLTLKPSSSSFPFYVTHDATIILETFHPLFSPATDFLVAVSEPVSRPKLIHEYKLTPYSLYASVCVGLTCDDILQGLNFFSKTILTPSVVLFIENCTRNCGKVKLSVRCNRYYLDVEDLEIKKVIFSDPVIKKCVGSGCVVYDVERVRKRCIEINFPVVEEFDFRSNIPSVNTGNPFLVSDQARIIYEQNFIDSGNGYFDGDNIYNENDNNYNINDEKDISNNNSNVNANYNNNVDNINNTNINNYNNEAKNTNSLYNNNIKNNTNSNNKNNINNFNSNNFISKLTSSLNFDEDEIHLPVYGSFSIDLRPNTQIRSYQETCLNKMFSNGRARSGIIVLPCGAGKTLVGITAMCTMKHPTLILCTSSVSVEQWKAQIKEYTSISDNDICTFTSDKKDTISNILITTYTMLAYSGKRSRDAQKVVNEINKKVWGLLVLDEVHVVPANMFRKVVAIKHYTKLGLTATLVREDDRIEDLNFLIGPKLYEADWQMLSEQGHIAKVECIEIWCRMSPSFYREYLISSSRKKRVLSVMNPGKFRATDFLIKKHEKIGDKIIVFSDNVFALKSYAIKLNKPFIYGPTSQQERMHILNQFRTNPKINCIFLSKVGDTSIDLPEATCLIQISSHFGSRRQEAQRLGRILRAKRRNDPGFKVWFYSLVSKDTDEMFYSAKRQQFLVDQGYSFRIMQDLKIESNIFKTKNEEKELLMSVMVTEENEEESENGWEQGKIKEMSGGENIAYMDKSITKKRKK